MARYLDEPEIATTKRYFKAKAPGDYTLRLLADPTVGALGWKAKKPVRKRAGEAWLDTDTDGDQVVKTVWMAPVLNLDLNIVQVWEIPQKSIRDAIRNLESKKAWGPITGYEIVLTRKGTTMDDTEYSLTPQNKGDLTAAQKELWDEVCAFGKFNIEELFRNGDPFDSKLPSGDDKDIPF